MRRDGHARPLPRSPRQISDLPARELVPGDIVHLKTGDKVPADVRVLRLRTATVRCEQASLTGAGAGWGGGGGGSRRGCACIQVGQW